MVTTVHAGDVTVVEDDRFQKLMMIGLTLAVGKQIPSKEIPSETGDPLKETKNMIEDENGKEVSTSTRGTLKKKEILRDENDKHVRTSIGEQLKNKEMFRDEMGKTSTHLH